MHQQKVFPGSVDVGFSLITCGASFHYWNHNLWNQLQWYLDTGVPLLANESNYKWNFFSFPLRHEQIFMWWVIHINIFGVWNGLIAFPLFFMGRMINFKIWMSYVMSNLKQIIITSQGTTAVPGICIVTYGSIIFIMLHFSIQRSAWVFSQILLYTYTFFF